MSEQSTAPAATDNRFKSALAENRAMIGLWVAAGDPYVASIAGGAGFDWLVIDGEHGPNDVRSVLAQLMALQASSAALVVRPPASETWMIKQFLDIGAETLLVPMVNTREQAEDLVRAVHYPPRGVRGMGAAIARASNFNRFSDYAARAGENICLLVQAETRTAMENLAEIAAVEGVDGVFIGPADLAADMGADVTSEEVQHAIKDGIETIIDAGKPAGILTFNAALNRKYIELGAKFVAVGADVTAYSTALDALAAEYGRGRGRQPANAGY